TASPCLALPRPAGRPAPSGPMLMSQGAMSAGAIGCPNCGACAKAGETAMSTAAQKTAPLRIHIARLPLFVDAPAGDRAVVISAAQSAFRDELSARRLHHAGVVRRAALQHRRATVPLPRRAKPSHGLGQHRLLQRRGSPAL